MHTGGKTFRRGTWRILTLNLPISQRNLLWHYKQKHKYQCPSGMQRGTRGPQTPRRRTISSSWALDSRDNSPFLLWETQRLLFLSRSRSFPRVAALFSMTCFIVSICPHRKYECLKDNSSTSKVFLSHSMFYVVQACAGCAVSSILPHLKKSQRLRDVLCPW